MSRTTPQLHSVERSSLEYKSLRSLYPTSCLDKSAGPSENADPKASLQRVIEGCQGRKPGGLDSREVGHERAGKKVENRSSERMLRLLGRVWVGTD
jgi:hypothetical protein